MNQSGHLNAIFGSCKPAWTKMAVRMYVHIYCSHHNCFICSFYFHKYMNTGPFSDILALIFCTQATFCDIMIHYLCYHVKPHFIIGVPVFSVVWLYFPFITGHVYKCLSVWVITFFVIWASLWPFATSATVWTILALILANLTWSETNKTILA